MLRMEADGAASELTEKLWRTPRFRELFDGQDLTPKGCAYVRTAVRRKVQDLLGLKQQAVLGEATLHAYAQHLEAEQRGSNDDVLNHLISEERRERIRCVLDAYCNGDPQKHAYFNARMAGRRHNAAAREAGVEWEGRCRGWWKTLRKRLEETPQIS